MMPKPVVLMKNDSVFVPAGFPCLSGWCPGRAEDDHQASRFLNCYKVKSGSTRSVTLGGIRTVDFLGSSDGRLGKPAHVCVRFDVNGTDPAAERSPDGVVCYKAKWAGFGFLSKPLNQIVDQHVGDLVVPASARITVLKEYCVSAEVQ